MLAIFAYTRPHHIPSYHFFISTFAHFTSMTTTTITILSSPTRLTNLTTLTISTDQKNYQDKCWICIVYFVLFGTFTLSVLFYILHTFSEPKEGKEVLNAYFLFRGGWLDRMEGRTNCKIKVQSLPTCTHKTYTNLICFFINLRLIIVCPCN